MSFIYQHKLHFNCMEHTIKECSVTHIRFQIHFFLLKSICEFEAVNFIFSPSNSSDFFMQAANCKIFRNNWFRSKVWRGLIGEQKNKKHTQPNTVFYGSWQNVAWLKKPSALKHTNKTALYHFYTWNRGYVFAWRCFFAC